MTAPHIVLSAGEPSGDQLGADLAEELRRRYPQARLSGIGGDKMAAAGVTQIADYRPLAVMGYWDALLSLPAILSVRRRFLSHLKTAPADLFIGIDAPDFNLGIARQLRGSRCRTVQYVAPSVWMWRQKRLRAIKRAVDAVWCLLPFEKKIYQDAGIAATFVGHPAARRTLPDRSSARSALAIPESAALIGLLPGSRRSELKRHLPIFKSLIHRLRDDNRRFVVAAADEQAARQIRAQLPDIPIGERDHVLAAADVAVVKSGTATLETAMAGVPMVIVYRLSPMAHWAVRHRRFALPYFGLPNILAERFIAPELLMAEADPTLIARETSLLLGDSAHRQKIRDVFAQLRVALSDNTQTPGQAAAALLSC